MAIRTVRLDNDAERLLEQIIEITGFSISAAFKEGLRAFESELRKERTSAPYSIYKELDLGPGEYAVAPSSDLKKAIKGVTRRKHGR